MHNIADWARWLQDRLSEPWVGGIALPFAASLLSAALLARVGRKLGAQIAGAGLAVGVTAGFVWLVGGLPFRQSLPFHALGEVAVLALGCGLLAGAVGLGGRALQIATVAGALAAVVHTLGGLPSRTALESGRNLGFLLVAAGAAVGAARLSRMSKPAVLPLCSLLSASAGLAAVAGFGRALLLAQLAEAMAAACFALTLLCWPKPRLATGAAVFVPGAAILGALVQASVTAAFTAPWPTLLLVLCFFPEEIAARLPGPKGQADASPAAALGGNAGRSGRRSCLVLRPAMISDPNPAR